MKRFGLLTILMTAAIFLSGCAGVENKEGKFYDLLVKPMEWLLHFFSGQFGGSYGLAIVVITILIRLVLMPLMLRNYKSQQEMKIKMDALRPEMEDIQKQLKEAKETGNKDDQTRLQQEMMGLYSKHGVNPLNMGCLPLVLQMPIIMGLYFAILYSPEVKETKFLWFNLGSPDMIMMLIAGAVYFVQARVSLWTMPDQQKQQMKMFIYLSPIMIMFISFKAVAALPLYWAVGGILLIFQTYLGRKLYFKEPAVQPAGSSDKSEQKSEPKKESKPAVKKDELKEKAPKKDEK
ncbi:membrane protein insertase YidC [Sporosarcina sp. Marseille-Q4063]|uniref:membrane protein insertase YidC n=1 Tax=Sporosarcina sp. Marseille-Q4063 TaxID=2810514 RepID=UPI001BAFBAC4|nr:membrane protein insertase YidC [Sporosarcina sp. Marseille-Q4063]QUW23744.1 membrane protein insertase YidC [Sporosarcina sp. Marseille-Q4063]